MDKFGIWLRDSTNELIDNDVIIISQTLLVNPQADLVEQALLILTNSGLAPSFVNILTLVAVQLLDRCAAQNIEFNNQMIEN